MSSVSTYNYAEQVLREEADRIAALKLPASAPENQDLCSNCSTNMESKASKLNIKDEDDFPTLGNVKVVKPVWTSSEIVPPVKPAPKPSIITTFSSISGNGSTSSSMNFSLPLEHQRKNATGTVPLSVTCNRVMKSTNTIIEASTSSQSKTISFVIRGKSADILAAKRQLWSILAQNGTIEFEVPTECLGYIIGPSGKNLKEIESISAVKIQIPKGEDWTGSIIITGDFEGVAMARDKILSIVNERTNKVIKPIDLQADREFFPFLWKKNISGIDLEELKQSFPECKIKSQFSTRQITLNGDRDQVDAVASIISEAIVRLRTLIKSVSTQLAKSLHRPLIGGSKGSFLQQFESESGCLISIPKSDDPSNIIIIYGPEDVLLKGFSLLMERAKGLSSQNVKIIPEIQFKLLQNVPKYRNDLWALEKEFDIQLYMNSKDSSIDFEGKKEAVLEAIKEGFSKRILPQLANIRVFDILVVDQDYLKHVIGKKGQTLQQIQKEFEVEIVIEAEEKRPSSKDSDDGSELSSTVCEDNNVIFMGNSVDSVKRAKEHVIELVSTVSDLVTLSTKIDSKYHGMLIGSRGANLVQLREKYPTVFIKFIEEENLIVFKGPKAESEACKTEMVAKAEGIRHEIIMNSYTQTIQLSGSINSFSGKDRQFLIGFAREHDCKLIFSNEKEITIQGTKKSVDLVLPLIREQIKMIEDRGSLTFSVDSKYRGILIGADGKNLKHLIQKYYVKIDFANNKDSEKDSTDSVPEEASSLNIDKNEIKITGPKANIHKAKDELLDLLNYHLSHDNNEILSVPSAAVPSIIGKNGSVIDGIKIETDCDVKIDKSVSKSTTQGSMTAITLSGTLESISSARDRINLIVSEFLSQAEVAVMPEEKAHIKELTQGFKRMYRKFIAMHQPGLSVFVKESSIVLKGPKDAVEVARVELESLFKSIASKEFIASDLTDISPGMYGKILGVGGSVIRGLQQDLNCEIIVPRPGVVGPVQVIGLVKDVAACEEKIRALCVEEQLFKFPTKKVKDSIISKYGDEISKISGVQWKDHPNGIVLIGNVESCEAAKTFLTAKIN